MVILNGSVKPTDSLPSYTPFDPSKYHLNFLTHCKFHAISCFVSKLHRIINSWAEAISNYSDISELDVLRIAPLLAITSNYSPASPTRPSFHHFP